MNEEIARLREALVLAKIQGNKADRDRIIDAALYGTDAALTTEEIARLRRQCDELGNNCIGHGENIVHLEMERDSLRNQLAAPQASRLSAGFGVIGERGMTTEDLIADLRGRINPAYAATLGTESYERRLCAEALELQLDEIERLRGELEAAKNVANGNVDAKFAAWKQVEEIDRDNERLRAALEDKADTASIALRKAWQLGQTYWQQADSEYTSHHKKADVTQAKFQELIDETRAAILAEVTPNVTGVQEAVKALCEETLYEGGKKDNRVSVRFLARMSVLKLRAELAPRDEPLIAEALALLGEEP